MKRIQSLLLAFFAVGVGAGSLASFSPCIAQTGATTNAPRPSVAQSPRFLPEILAFEEGDKKAPPPQGAVLFLGSSSIRYWTTLAQDFPELPVINRGFGGSQIEDSINYAERIVLPYKPKLIVFYAGGNDLNDGKAPEAVAKDFQKFADTVQTALPATTIAFISINPSLKRWEQEGKILQANTLIEKIIRDTNSPTRKLAYIDSHAGLLGADGRPQENLLRPDKLHLNADGYKAWVAIVRPQILALATKAGVAPSATATATATAPAK